MPEDPTPEGEPELTADAETAAAIDAEEERAARIAAVTFDDETEAAILAVAAVHLMPPASVLEAVRELIADDVLICPPPPLMDPAAEARLQLARFADALPGADDAD